MVSQTIQKNLADSIFKNKGTAVADIEYLELDLSKAEDRETFLESVENVHAEAIEYLDIAKSDNYNKLELDIVSGEEMFNVLNEKLQTLQKLVADCRKNLVPENVGVSDSFIDELQTIYNDMITFRNYIFAGYKEEELGGTESDEVSLEEVGDKTRPPSEVEVNLLMGQVLENQFLVSSEVDKARDLYELFNRYIAVHELKKAVDVFNNLKMLINDFENKPEAEVIPERAIRILEHVYATQEISENILEKITDLFEDVREIELNSSGDNKKLLDAYKVLEQFARKHEADWLSICGVNIPEPGPAGIKQAKKMYKVLLAERDYHSDLTSNSEKKVLIDELVLRLSQISSEGLSADRDIPEIIRLARTVDIPQGQIEVIEDTQNNEKQAGEARHSPSIKRKTMEIIYCDDEGDIAIQVANEAMKSISLEEEKTMNRNIWVDKDISLVESHVLARTEKSDPINQVINHPPLSVNLYNNKYLEKKSVKDYLRKGKYAELIKSKYSSATIFDIKLKTKVLQIEASTVDIFEKWLGENHRSAFNYLERMRLSEIMELNNNPDRRKILDKEDIKYETFLVWMDLIPDMQAIVGVNIHITFGELFAGWFIEIDNSDKVLN